ncbi:MAG: glycoside hydrolase family 15 protein [Deltaproteobacteria bacterium]|nr:glycoside hydrolase family 15 protein [Deltaproteobacteria bacterium]
MRYGIIGNCKTAALVHESGSIDWLCFPKFDSPSVFAALLDPDGGHFAIHPTTPGSIHQTYLPGTNILQTEFDDGQNAFCLIDFMPRYREGDAYKKPLEIVRLLKPLRGNPSVRVSFEPRMNYARGETAIKLRKGLITASSELESLYLYSCLDMNKIVSKEPIPLQKEVFLLLSYHEKLSDPTWSYANDLFQKTKSYWETWASHCHLPPLYPEAVLRSALALKLLTYEDSGAILAAATTSLPEIIGEQRNWDYRYCWLRDASLMLEALKSIGHFEEARGFIHFLLKIFENRRTKIQIVYGIGGRTSLEETLLPHLKGYKNSGPVRIGNAACQMQQNDIFGEVLNTIYLYYFHYQIEPMPEEVWSMVKFLVNTSAKEWRTPDAGIWEFRHRKEHFTFSKVLAWVALDRGIQIAKKTGKHYAVENWTPIAREIHADIVAKGWVKSIHAYSQIYGSKNLDASLLMMHRYGFIKATDPRWIATVNRCQEMLVQNGFVFRYTNPDDFGKPKSAFIVAGLWLAKALLSIGKREEARELFDKTLSHANHLGLFSEDFDVDTGELLGNFPQAYSHMAIINTAMALNQEVPPSPPPFK